MPLLVAGYRLDFGFQGLASGLEAFQRRVQMEFRTGVGVAATVPVFPDPAPFQSTPWDASPLLWQQRRQAHSRPHPLPGLGFRVMGLGLRV